MNTQLDPNGFCGIQLTPFMRWTGGKYSQTEIVKFVKELSEPHVDKIWIEPFCGALGMTFRLNPQTAILADTNKDVINLYKHLRTDKAQTFDWESFSEHNEPAKYYAMRNLYNKHKEAANMCLYFWWLNQAGFQGLTRYNSKNELNTPMGYDPNTKTQMRKILYPSMEKLKKFQEMSTSWKFLNQSYKDTLVLAKDLEDRAIVYCDPPYDDNEVEYSAKGFNWNDQQILAAKLSMMKCPVIASNHASSRVLKLYSSLGFQYEILEAKRRVGTHKYKYSEALEMIAWKNC